MGQAMQAIFPVTSFYASLCGLLFLALTVVVVRMRRQLKLPYGDGGNSVLRKGIAVCLRAHIHIHIHIHIHLHLHRTGRSDPCNNQSFVVMQAHSNASQYMPITLLFLALTEADGRSVVWLLHMYGRAPQLS